MSDAAKKQSLTIARSHSALKVFETCPFQYEAKYIIKDVKFVQGEAAKWGDYVHNCLERYLRDKVPLPSNVVQYQRYADAVLNLSKKFGRMVLSVEENIAFTRDYESCDWFAKGGVVWGRCKIDVLAVFPDAGIAFVFDWKTGKYRPDHLQLELYAWVTMWRFPEVNKVRVGDVWLKEGKVDPPTEYGREDYDALRLRWEARNNDLDNAIDSGIYAKQTSGLCNGWCEVRRCPNWKPKREFK